MLFVCLALCAFPPAVHAKEAPEPVNKEALRALARDFVARIGGRLKAHDDKIKTENIADNPLSLIPDGEILLLRPRAEKFVMDREIASLKQNGTIYYALTELIEQLELSIDYNDERKTGSGWFLREDWLVRFDFIDGVVVSRGKEFKVGPQDIYEDQGQVFISRKAAKEWLEIDTTPDIAQQYLDIRTPYPFPALARNARERAATGRTSRNTPVLPRLESDYKNFDINTAEIQQTVRATRRKDAPTTVNHQNVTSVQGDVLKHNAYGIGFWDSQEKLTSVRARLTREEEEATLLGPLKARFYSLGDSDVAPLPLTGNSSQELGVRVNNNPLRNADFQETTISGDSLPGWDVELYRDGVLVDRLRVAEDARYEFRDIQLFAGENLFEVFFYGPTGEIRRDNFNIPVTEEFLNTQDNTYDVSLTFSDSQTYGKFPSDDEDANTPQLVARYNKVIGNTLTYAGVRTNQVDGEQKAYLATGFTNVLGGFVLDGGAATDEKGATSVELGTRKNIDDWQLSLRSNLRDEAFIAEDESDNIFSVNGNATKNFRTPYDTLTTLNTNLLYGQRADDSTQTAAQLSLSNQMGRFNLSNTLSYDKLDNLESGMGQDATVNNFLTARMSFGKVFTRAGVNYNVRPETKVDNYFAQVAYQPTPKLGTDLTVEHDPDQRFSEARLNVNYRHENFRLTPFVNVDTNSQVQAGMKLTTTLVDTPGQTLPSLTGDRVIGRGLVSSFVYHDKNGNNVFDGGDVPLPDVYVESVNIARRAPTNEKGYSLIDDLPESFVTDIRVDKSTLPDPFMIPGFAGVSVYPRAGQMTELSFPIHLAGEIDGTVLIAGRAGSEQAQNVGLTLIPVDGKTTEVAKSLSATDGFFVFSNVPPGNYLLAVDSEDAARVRAGGATPVPVRIGYDGTVLSGKDVVLEQGRVQVPVAIESYFGKDYKTPFFALETGKAEGQSKLAGILSRLVERKSNIRADEGLSPIALENGKNLKVLPGQDWTAHYNRCQLLNDERIPCKIILFVPQQKDRKPTRVAQK